MTGAEGAFIGNVLQEGDSIGNVLIKGPFDTYSWMTFSLLVHITHKFLNPKSFMLSLKKAPL